MKTFSVSSETAKINQSRQVSWIIKKSILLNLQEPANGSFVRSAFSGGLELISWSFSFLPLFSEARRVGEITWVISGDGGKEECGYTTSKQDALLCVCVSDWWWQMWRHQHNEAVSCDKSNILNRVIRIWICSFSFLPNPSWDAPNPS